MKLKLLLTCLLGSVFLSTANAEAQKDELPLSERLPAKIQKIQKELPAWSQKPGNKEKATAFMQKLKAQLEDKNFEEAEKTADSILETIGTSAPAAAEAQKDDLPLSERLPAKIQKIQKELPAWIQKTGNQEKAGALMQKLKEHLDDKNFEEAEKTADSILATIGASEPAATPAIPEEALKKLRHDVGGSFIVSRDKVQEELKLTKEQKEKLEQLLREVLPHAVQLFQKIQGLDPAERRKELGAFRPKAQEKLAAVLKEALTDGQRKRLRQLELQREGLRNGQIWNDLQVTDEQRKQFMAMIQRAQKETQRLLEELQKAGKSKGEIQPRVIKVRDDLESKLEGLLTDAQKKQWKEMRGEPMDLADLFDL
jgi:hypothetical protein